MDMTNGLLVVIMFTIILSLGIGNILMTLASLINRTRGIHASRLHVSWVVLLLLVYFNFFWHSLDILDVKEWQFQGFLYIITGPILMLMATQVVLPTEDIVPGEADSAYFAISPQFFVLLALTQLWVIGSDAVLGNGFTRFSAVNSVAVVLAFWLAVTKNPMMHRMGAVAAWLLFVVFSALRGAGVIG